jgi:hypothetical protein
MLVQAVRMVEAARKGLAAQLAAVVRAVRSATIAAAARAKIAPATDRSNGPSLP